MSATAMPRAVRVAGEIPTTDAPHVPQRTAPRWLAALLATCVTSLAVVVLHRQLRAYHYHDLVQRVAAVPAGRIAVALGLTALAYGVLVSYDALALRYVHRRLPLRRLALASALSSAFSHLLSYSTVTGGSIRYRFWSVWGLSAADIAQGVAFIVITNIIGVVTTAGATLAFGVKHLPLASAWSAALLQALGIVLLLLVTGYVVWNVAARRDLHVRGMRLRMPGPALAMAQVGVSTVDWALAGTVLYALLPPAGGLTFPLFLGSFLLAQGVGIVSYVPGGIGVFEATLIVLLRPYLGVTDVLGALVAYRAIYYLLPFSLAVATLGGYEILRRRASASGVVDATRRSLAAVAPDVLSGATFLAGVVLLVSGATPSVHSRLAWLDAILPLGVIEVTHFIGSLAGVGLLILALGLRRRLDVAYHLTVMALVAGIGASLLKGGDWEEALILAGVLAALLPSRKRFYRRAALTSEPWSPGWAAAIALVLAGSIWLGLFSHKNVAYAHELWWNFSLYGDAPRFLRASVGAIGLVVAVALARLFRPARPPATTPTPGELDRAARIAYESGHVEAYLATLGDKSLLFGETGGLMMYAVSGRSWVALGDSIGAPAQRAELAWRLKEMADRYGSWPVFYEVGREDLSLYIDLGLTLLKIGEEGRVPLESFSLEGGERRQMRRTLREVERAGGTFELLSCEDVPQRLAELRRVSDVWLAAKHTREKGFSLGYFHEAYLRRFPVAVVRCHDRIVAFANVWLGARHGEMSLDLMRYEAGAPHGVMEYLFLRLMLWGKAQGYQWFSLGMAPFSGFDSRALAPLWSRVGALVYRHGEHFYNFQGLRQYKEKFDPVWEPKYLAAPGGLALPRVLLNIASLISGGLGGVVRK